MIRAGKGRNQGHSGTAGLKYCQFVEANIHFRLHKHPAMLFSPTLNFTLTRHLLTGDSTLRPLQNCKADLDHDSKWKVTKFQPKGQLTTIYRKLPGLLTGYPPPPVTSAPLLTSLFPGFAKARHRKHLLTEHFQLPFTRLFKTDMFSTLSLSPFKMLC